MRSAIVLLSGGLDSATTLYYAKSKKFKTYCLVFDYGQRHSKEVRHAQKIARASRSPCQVVKITLPWKGSALLDKKISIPLNRRIIPKEIPVTYVPARNIIFLSYAASFAETAGAGVIFIGANAIDYSGYPDCRPEFYHAYNRVLSRGLKTGVRGKPVRIMTPLIHMTKTQIIRLGIKLKVPYQLTWSCYQGRSRPCGKCDSCLIRAKGFSQAAQADPALSRRR